MQIIQGSNGERKLTEHTAPIQSYPKDTFEKQSILPEGAKETGFERLGIHIVKQLTGDEPKVILDENDTIDLPAITSADTASTQADEIKKETVEMAEDGIKQTPAEHFAERSQNQAGPGNEEGLDEVEDVDPASVKEKLDAKDAKGKGPQKK